MEYYIYKGDKRVQIKVHGRRKDVRVRAVNKQMALTTYFIVEHISEEEQHLYTAKCN